MKSYVLCVDDDRQVLDSLRRDLESLLPARVQLEVCESAAEADEVVAELEQAGHRLELIICDQVMPVEDGVHFLERLHARQPSARKVLLTGYSGLESAIYGINRAGLTRYLEKPWSREQLAELVGQLADESHTGDPQLEEFARRDGPDLYAKVEAFADYFQQLRAHGYYFWQRPLATACLPRVDSEARSFILLASNNYLGLTTHPRVLAGAREALDRFGAGSGAVPLLSGTTELHRQLEEALAHLKGGEATCLFPTGYSANVGIITALARDTDVIFLDKLVHASLVDGARASGARIRTFHHNDPEDLERKLSAEISRSPRCGRLVVIDGVYSMDGDLAPVPELLEVAHRHGARLMIDEAHSTGVLGERGRGVAEHFGGKLPIDLVMGTLSKSLGGIGGFCVAPFKVVDYLRHYARSHMFSTSLPPATVGGLLAALAVLHEEPERVAALRRKSERVRTRLQAAGLSTGASQTAIIPVIVGDQRRLAEIGKRVYAAGVYLNSVYYPAVPKEQCRLRLSLMATHEDEDLDQAVEVIVEAFRATG